MDIHALTAAELLELYQLKTLSPVEAVEALFDRIEKLNPDLNAFVTLNKDEATEQARIAERRCFNKNMRPLEGVPVAIKDLTNTKGLRTTYGCLVYKDYVPGRDAAIVKRLREAGAVIMGKTNTPEFGHKGTTDNPLFGPSRNPWHSERATGGSSGGSAAAVAAGFVPLAEGSDGGGSIRIPSSLCGVFGMKPSFGRLPADNHLRRVFSNINPFISNGPIARTVSDAALMFDAVQGDVPTDPFSLSKLEMSVYESLKVKRKSFRIGYTLDFGMYDIDMEVQGAFLHTLDDFREQGLHVERVDIQMKKTLRQFIEYFETLWTVGLAASSGGLLAKHGGELSDSLKVMIERGRGLSAVDFEQLTDYRAYIWHMMQGIFETVDVLVSPTLAAAAFRFDEEGPATINGRHIKRDSDWMLTQIYNLTGQPACSIPIGFTSSGLPIGMQAASRRLNDVTLFQFAKWAEDFLQTSTLADL